MPQPSPIIRFAYGQFSALQLRLLSDLSTESFAIIFAKRSESSLGVFSTISARFPEKDDLLSSGIGHVTPSKQYIYDVLAEVVERHDVDTIIDVHTHPFSDTNVHFSSIDDDDERGFYRFLADRLPGLHYGSIVLGTASQAARFWSKDSTGRIVATPATVIPASDYVPESLEDDSDFEQGSLARVKLAVGIDTLRKIALHEKVAIIGVGGLGSIIAENLVQMGFSNLVLIDPDIVEATNLGRIIGAREADARHKRRKVSTLKRHLKGINSGVEIEALAFPIEDNRVWPSLVTCTWLIVCTDNHTSRYIAQKLSHDLFIPLISAGVNITVDEGVVTDVSGEVVNCKVGCGYCLMCLGRVNHMKILVESEPSSIEGLGLVHKGYISGAHVAEPAVKTLNSIIASLTVDTLINEFTKRQDVIPILVYESNRFPAIFSDQRTFEILDVGCAACLQPEQWD